MKKSATDKLLHECYEITDYLYHHSNLPKGITPLTYMEICTAATELQKGKAYLTISANAAEICKKCGLDVQEEGIGWIVRADNEQSQK